MVKYDNARKKPSIYDLIGELGEGTRDEALKLIQLAGKVGNAGDGYLFGSGADELLRGLNSVTVRSQDGRAIKSVPRQAENSIFRDPPDWLKPETEYKVEAPPVSEEELEKLAQLRDEIARKLSTEGTRAFEEFNIAAGLLTQKPESRNTGSPRIPDIVVRKTGKRQDY